MADPDRVATRVAVAQLAGASADAGENVRTHVRLASLAAEHGARLVVFPELSLTGYDRGLTPEDAFDAMDARLLPLQALADAQGLVLMTGAPIASTRGLHIGTLSFTPGAGVKAYLKRFLGAGEEVAFVPGPGGDPLLLADQVVAPAICADVNHPEHARDAAGGGATMYAASCLLDESGYEAETGRLRGYAREHGMLVMMANYGPPVRGWSAAGRSAIWSNDGSLLASAPQVGEALVLAGRGEKGTVVTRCE